VPFPRDRLCHAGQNRTGQTLAVDPASQSDDKKKGKSEKGRVPVECATLAEIMSIKRSQLLPSSAISTVSAGDVHFNPGSGGMRASLRRWANRC
jgi:hypothetical protein